ncbi:unnamed protein product [Moneuplotes crassus]|uniref:Uncharacterized protein n=1 Tax=Euplotes crassus TaxID=5936 RepID=A0AAD1Y0Y1_EUPCR|nr:unnamed protein product [Moneuplotes crassus]
MDFQLSSKDVNYFAKNKEFYSEIIGSNCIESKSEKQSTALERNGCSLIQLRDKGHKLQGFSSTVAQPAIEDSSLRNQVDVIAQNRNRGNRVSPDSSPPSQVSNKICRLLQDTTRHDQNLRDCLRFCRKFFLQFFKNHNPEIVRKRYVNCPLKQVLQSTTLTLFRVMADEEVTPSLAYFLVGILSLKSPSRMRCSSEVKKEIGLFLETTRKFSRTKFRAIMKSPNLQTLVKHLANHCDDPRALKLRDALECLPK